jgi:hypothetical protein
MMLKFTIGRATERKKEGKKGSSTFEEGSRSLHFATRVVFLLPSPFD